MIEVTGLTKRFGDVTAVDDLSFKVEEGQLFALLGRNGAGKSTTISCMTTIMDFDAGQISLDGKQVGTDDSEIRESLGVVFQNSLLDPRLTVAENLELRAKLYGSPRPRINQLLEQVELADLADRRYGVLSGGERRRVDIARALLHAPRTLFLDEPTTGLDPQSRETVWRVIAELREAAGLTVVLTTHYMEETENADQVLLLNRGQTIAAGSPLSLRARFSAPRLSLAVAEADVPAMLAARERHLAAAGPDFMGAPVAEGGAWHFKVPNSQVALAILDDLRGQLLDFEFRQGSMQDVFLSVTGEGL